MKVRYTRQALLDLGEIHDGIAAENAEAASRVVTEIEHQIQQLTALSSSRSPGES